MIKYLVIFLLINLCACSDVSTKLTPFAKGEAGEHTPIPIDTEGNIYGFYEYLPQSFDTEVTKKLPLIFFWNGQNAITGNGDTELHKLLNQGLPNLIQDGHHYPAIIISGMLPKWNKSDIHPFINYILKRYDKHIDDQRIYMTGFSAGGGVTLRYISEYPDKFAAIIPIAPAAQPPGTNQPSAKMGRVDSWFFHNSGDMKVEIWRSNIWHKALRDTEGAGEHKITRPDKETHNAWKDAYASDELWTWLISKRKTVDRKDN